MKYLFFDVETTGLPKNYMAPDNDVNNWPRIVQIAWVVVGSESVDEYNAKSYVIKPDGFKIPKETSEIHGITHEYAMEFGCDLNEKLHEFNNDLSGVQYLVAHNLDFDKPVVSCEMFRCGIIPNIIDKNLFCTMKHEDIINLCKLKQWGVYEGYKWPKLSELFKELFGFEFGGQHDAKNDVVACAKCFFELKARDII